MLQLSYTSYSLRNLIFLFWGICIHIQAYRSSLSLIYGVLCLIGYTRRNDFILQNTLRSTIWWYMKWSYAYLGYKLLFWTFWQMNLGLLQMFIHVVLLRIISMFFLFLWCFVLLLLPIFPCNPFPRWLPRISPILKWHFVFC